MEQKQNSTGEGENLRCGVSTVGVRSGPTGWSQDPQHEDRPCMGPRVVALWDTAACPGHKGAVWGLCGGCVGAVWALCPMPCCHMHHLSEEAMPVPAHSLHRMQKWHRVLATPHSAYGASAG